MNNIKIEDTNISFFGSPLEDEIKKHAAESETAFIGAGQEPGLQIWRINKFKLESVSPPPEFTGFYSGDSYIVLKTYRQPNEIKLRHDIHFWLGQATTIDEAGTAAYKTVELDELLGGEPVEHREVQNYESEQFMNYFRENGGVFFVLSGGHESGFRHVVNDQSTKYPVRLIRIEQDTICEVSLNREQLVDNSVFILDTGLIVYQWHGKKSSPFDRNHAATIAIRKDNVKINVIEQGSETGEFWQFFSNGNVKTPFLVGTTVQHHIQDEYWVYSQSGIFNQVDQQHAFNENNIVIKDTGRHIWVWVGNNALTLTERRNAFWLGQMYLKQVGKPSSTHISVVKENKRTFNV